MLTASIILHRKPKDGTNGKDGESVKVIETSVTYAISASAMTPPSEPSDWKAEVQKTTDSKPYLWSRTIVKYSGGASTTTYSVSYNGKDGVNGTSFTPKGTATAFYHQADHNTFTEEGIYLVDIYTTASAEQKLYVITRKADGSISYTFAEIGDGYNVGGHLYVAQKPGWVDFGDIKGTDGLDGKDGKDAIDIVLSPTKLTFTADTNGNPLITSDNNKSMLTVMRGKQDVSRGITDVVVTGMLCNAITSTVNDNRMIFIESISKQEVSVTTSDGTVKKYVPATSGSINISLLLDGVRYTASLPFTVDVKTVLGGVYSDNEKFYTHYEEITNGLEDKINQVQDDTNDNLTQLSSRIEETASQIKLEVSQQPYAVRNLLPGSSFRRQGEGPYIDPQVRIERNTGKGGVSCLHIATQYGGSGECCYLGAFWDSTYAPFAASGIPVPSDSVAGQNIPIQSDTDYTLSCWVKADNTDLTFCIEVFEMAAYNSANRGTAHRQTFTVSQIDTWQLVEFTIHGKEITSPYLAVNFWCNAKTTKPLTDGTYPAVNAYICQPMLDAASQYSGWSLSPSDGDYQGGNLLDSTATLIPSDSATSTADKSTPLLQVADSAITLRSYEGVYSVAHVNNTTGSPIELLRWNVENVIQDNHDYILSFLAKGTGSITTYLYRDGTPRIYVESINSEQPQLSADGAVSIPVTSEWKRYWVHYRLRATAQYPNLPDKLLFRVMPDNDISICQPKLEDGARPTSYTERKTDLVDKASLKKAGIEITTDKVKLYGDKVEVVTTKVKEDGTKEDTQTTMFSNGKLNADLIETEHIYAKSKRNGDIAGHFGYYDIDEASDLGERFPFWVGASTAEKAPFRINKDGTMYAKNAMIGSFFVDYGYFGEKDYLKQTIDESNGKYSHYAFAGIGSGCGFFLISDDKISGDGSGFESYVRLCEYNGSFTDSNGNKYDNINKPALQVRQSLSSFPSKDVTAIGARIKAKGRSDGESVALEVDATNGLKNHAIKIKNGDVAGFRTCIQSISQSINLNGANEDMFESGMVLICNNNSDITITLPSHGINGDNFTFIKAGKGKINVVHPTNSSLYHQANGSTGTFVCTSQYEHVHLIYYNLEWYSECSRD